MMWHKMVSPARFTIPQKNWIQNFKLVGLKYKEKKNSNRDLYSIKKNINTKNYDFIFYF